MILLLLLFNIGASRLKNVDPFDVPERDVELKVGRLRLLGVNVKALFDEVDIDEGMALTGLR